MNKIETMSLATIGAELAIDEMVEIQGGSGQDVADCISAVYGNMGWLSVAYWIGSAFVPELVVAVAIDCVIHNC